MGFSGQKCAFANAYVCMQVCAHICTILTYSVVCSRLQNSWCFFCTILNARCSKSWGFMTGPLATCSVSPVLLWEAAAPVFSAGWAVSGTGQKHLLLLPEEGKGQPLARAPVGSHRQQPFKSPWCELLELPWRQEALKVSFRKDYLSL